MSSPSPRLTKPLRRSHSWLWALVLAVAVHAAFAVALLPDPAVIEIERSAGSHAVVMGSLNAAFAAQSELPTPEAEEIDAVSDVPELVAPQPETLPDAKPVVEEVKPVAPSPVVDRPVLDVVETVEPVDVAPNAIRLAELVEPKREEPVAPEMVQPLPREVRETEDLKPNELQAVQPAPMREPEPIALTKPLEVSVLEARPPVKPIEVKSEPVEAKPVKKQKPKKARADRGKTRQSKSNADSRRGANQKSSKAARSAVAGQGGKRITAGGKALRSNYIGKVVAKLRRAKRYPSSARARRLTGVVLLSFTLDASGGLVSSRVARSSGHAVLDQAALQLVRKVRGFPRIPPELGRKTMPLVVPLEYLPGRR